MWKLYKHWFFEQQKMSILQTILLNLLKKLSPLKCNS